MKGKKLGVFVATAVAGLILAGHSIAGEVAADEPAPAKVKCSGINECKGTGACKGADNACAGQNGCKGKGWIQTPEADCTGKGGKVEK